jgi:hypothetical protein
LTRGDRRRNDRIEGLRRVVIPDRAILAIDLGDRRHIHQRNVPTMVLTVLLTSTLVSAKVMATLASAAARALVLTKRRDAR